MATLAWGDKFKLSRDGREEDNEPLYLKITKDCGCSTEILIPVDVWETIRHIPAIAFDLVDLTDSDIRELVEREYDDLLRAYQEIPSEQVRIRSIYAMRFLTDPDTEPKDAHVQLMMNDRLAERARQRSVQERVRQYQVVMEAAKRGD